MTDKIRSPAITVQARPLARADTALASACTESINRVGDHVASPCQVSDLAFGFTVYPGGILFMGPAVRLDA